MDKRRLISSLVAAGLAALAIASPASAADKLIATPAEKFITAPGGVDLRSGRFAYEEKDLAIGDEGSGGLVLSRTLTATVDGHSNPFGSLSHNWDVMASERRIAIDNPESSSGPDYQINVHFGGRSMTYQSRYSHIGFQQMSPGAFAPLTFTGDRASGSTVYTYTAADGTVALFRPIGSGDCSSTRRCAYVSEITEVDGTKFTFSYVSAGTGARLARVTSSRGYALVLEGSGALVTKACVVNLAHTAAGSACPAGAPASTYGYTGDGRLAAATGPDGSTSGFTYSSVAGGGTMGFVKPGASAPWLTNRFHYRHDEAGILQEVVDRQDYADGGRYTYQHNLSPPLTYRPQTLAGGSYLNALNEGGSADFDWPIAPGANTPGSSCTSFPCSPPMPDDPVTNPSYVYQQTPGPIQVSGQGMTIAFDYCDPAAWAGLPANEQNRCIVNPVPAHMEDSEGIRTYLKHDANQNVVEAKRMPKPGVPNPDGSVPTPIVTSAEYVTTQSKAANKPLWMKDARGHATSWTYAPEHGGVTSETGPAVDGVTPQKRYSYVQRTARLADGSAAGPPVWLLDRMSTCRTGNPSGAGCALGAADEVLTVYDYGPDSASNNLHLRGQSVVADGQALRTCFAYDGLGRKISETSPNGAVGLSACSGTAPTGPQPYTASTRYDADGRVTGTIGADPDGTGPLPHPAVRNSYDVAGRLIRIEQGILGSWQADNVQPAFWPGFAAHKLVDTGYDVLDRKVREAVSGVGPGGAVTASVTEYGYDLGGKLKCTAVRMNPDHWASPLADKCVPGPAHAVHGQDRISRNVYDAHGRLAEVWDGVGTPLQRREAAYTFNNMGKKTSLTDARGYRAEMKYDAFDRQSRWVFPSKTTPGVADPSDYEEYRYDGDGNRLFLRKRDGSVLTFQYDALKRMTAKIVPERSGLTAAQTRDVYYEYDLRGLQTKARFDSLSGEGVTTAYDGFGRVTSSTLAMAGASRTIGHLYDGDGNRVRITHSDSFFTYDYDGLNRFVGLRENGGELVAVASYDGPGRLVRSGWAAATDYGYDPAGRLQSLSHDLAGLSADHSLGFTYNPAGQIRSRSASNAAYAWTGAVAANRPYSVNGQNQYTAAGAATFSYDANGNLVSDGSTNFTYDVENRLVSASGAKNAALVYDPLGRLFQTSGGAAGVTRFNYDDDALVDEYDGSNTLVRRYVHGPAKGVDDPLIWYDNITAGWRRALVSDQQGSIIAVADRYGNPIAINSYDEYGIPGANNQGRFQYTGQAWIPELGMYYYKARIYSPTLGRFLQTDPIGYDDQINLYAYVSNDPANHSDPTGNETISCTQVGDKTPSCTVAADGSKNLTLKYTNVNTGVDGTVHKNTITRTFRGSQSTQVENVNTQISNLCNCSNNPQVAQVGIITATLKAIGNVVLGVIGPAPLRGLHSREAMESNRSSTNYWRGKSTDEIKQSLRPGQPESLKVKSDGTIMNGNTRVQILRERGVDVNSLPREPYP